MKNLKSIVTFITIAAIFCLSLSQNVFAEETHMAYKLKKLQPYVDELNSINEELGTDLVMLLSSQEDIDLAYSSYSNMEVDEFREYIIKLYNNEIRVECAASESISKHMALCCRRKSLTIFNEHIFIAPIAA